MYKTDPLFSITSQITHFSFEILSSALKKTSRLKATHSDVPFDFHSTNPASVEPVWEAETEYYTPFPRLRLRDSSDNLLQYHYPRWYDH